MFFRLQTVYFVDEYDRVFYHHAYKSHNADNGHEGERLAEYEKCRRNPAEYERETHEYQDYFFPVVEQQQQGKQHDENSYRHVFHQSAYRFVLKFAFTYPFHFIAFRQGDGFDFVFYLGHHFRRRCFI